MARLYVHPGDPPPPPEFRALLAPGPAEALLDPQAAAWRDGVPVAWGHDRYRTSFRAAWTADALAIRFDCEDDRPWWTIAERDGRLWQEEVVEMFLDPAGAGLAYAEVEISPANVVCDLRVDTPWPHLSSDPRWHWEGLVSRVTVEEQPGGRCRWTVSAVLPFAGLAGLSPDAAARVPPSRGDRWRFNVFRIKRPHGPVEPERDAIYAAWSVPSGPSFHDPAAFRALLFG